jgi:hypothetical protein
MMIGHTEVRRHPLWREEAAIPSRISAPTVSSRVWWLVAVGAVILLVVALYLAFAPGQTF